MCQDQITKYGEFCDIHYTKRIAILNRDSRKKVRKYAKPNVGFDIFVECDKNIKPCIVIYRKEFSFKFRYLR